MNFAFIKLRARLLFPMICTASLALYGGDAVDPFTPPPMAPPVFPDATFNVKDFGAVGDGVANDTPSINQAIEKCNAAGGGTVTFPPGRYAAASIHLKSHVRLLLDRAAFIFGAPDGFELPEPNPFSKYQDGGHSHFHDALMWGENLENFALVGGHVSGGSIGHGDPKPGHGDKLIAIKVGRNLLFQNVTHDKGGHFVYLLNDCENITLEHVVIKESRDAVDFMSCRNVQVHDCRFTGCADDTIGIKSDYALGRKIDSANFYVWDSYFESGCNGLQFGSETAGDFTNTYCWNIKIGRAMKAGISLTSNDGGVIDGAHYRDITIKGAASPIYMLITDRLRSGDPNKKTGTIRNVTLSNITVTDCQPGRQGPVLTSTISGRPESSLENITLENIKITYPGGGASEEADIVPPYPRDYSPRSLGPRPAAAFYVRHVKGLTLRNVEISYEAADRRPPLVAYDVDGLVLDHFVSPKSDGVAMTKFTQVSNVTVHDCPGMDDPSAAAK